MVLRDPAASGSFDAPNFDNIIVSTSAGCLKRRGFHRIRTTQLSFFVQLYCKLEEKPGIYTALCPLLSTVFWPIKSSLNKRK